jgi:hypothetical protein
MTAFVWTSTASFSPSRLFGGVAHMANWLTWRTGTVLLGRIFDHVLQPSLSPIPRHVLMYTYVSILACLLRRTKNTVLICSC